MALATESAIVCASAPLYVALTETVGGVRLGYSSIGSPLIPIKPAITMMIDITVANIGRFMKNLENIYLPLLATCSVCIFVVYKFCT